MSGILFFIFASCHPLKHFGVNSMSHSMTVLVKFQMEIRFSIELHGNSKLSMTSCPPSSAQQGRVPAGALVEIKSVVHFHNSELRGLNWPHFVHRLRPQCTVTLNLNFAILQNLKLFSIRVKELFEPIVLRGGR